MYKNFGTPFLGYWPVLCEVSFNEGSSSAFQPDLHANIALDVRKRTGSSYKYQIAEILYYVLQYFTSLSLEIHFTLIEQ